VIAVLVTGLSAVSTGSILIRLSQEAPSLTIAAWRMTLASLLLFPLYLRRRRSGTAGRWTGMHLVSGAALALHFAFWISSLRFTSVAVSVLLVDASPVVVAICSWLFLNERLTGRGLAGLVSTFAGSVLLLHNDLVTLGDWRGATLALAGAAAVAIYLLIGRRLRQESGLIEYIFPTYFIAACFLMVIALVSRSPLTGFSPTTWLFLFLLGLVPQCIGHTSYNWSLRFLPATMVATLTLGEPVLASLLAWWLLGERPSAGMLPGAILVAAGILLVTLGGVTTKKTSH
jgi:drug/metabolite transporter (DMT)-like permease